MSKRLLLLLLLPVLGCAANLEKTYDKTAPKVVKLGMVLADGRQGTCSGAYIDRYGTVLTCAHCVTHKGITKIFVKQDNGSYSQGVVFKIDKNRDLALISTLPLNYTPYFTLGSQVHRAQQVLLFGSPLGIQHMVTIGWIENLINGSHIGMERLIVFHSAATNGGNSGGPLTDVKGRLVGIGEGVMMANPFVPAAGLGFAVSIDDIKDFLGVK